VAVDQHPMSRRRSILKKLATETAVVISNGRRPIETLSFPKTVRAEILGEMATMR